MNRRYGYTSDNELTIGVLEHDCHKVEQMTRGRDVPG
jgi:hypothetical protein